MISQIKIVKYIDRLVGPALAGLVPSLSARKPDKIERLLVIRPGGMGDAVLLLPILKMLKRRYTSLSIDILCESRNSGIFTSTFLVNDVFHYHQPGRMLSAIRGDYDVIVDTEQSHFLSAVICRLNCRALTAGYGGNGREKMFHQVISYRKDMYEADMFLALFRSVFELPARVEWEGPFLRPLHSKQLERMKQLDDSMDPKRVFLFPGASNSAKVWPEERWGGVADALVEQGFKPVLLGGPMEKEVCSRIASMCKKSVINDLSNQLSLPETSWLFERGGLLITGDSGLLHLAVLSGIQTLALFGPSSHVKWAPKGDRHRVIDKKYPCGPCTVFGTIPPCPYSHGCMHSIASDDVIIQAKNLLAAENWQDLWLRGNF